MKLPGWVVDNRTAVMQDVAPYAHVDPAASWPLVVQAGLLGSAQLRWDPRPDEALGWRDPLPPDSIRALARLRAAWRTER